ncbi:hypothetical protein [Streptomyces sp. NPDC005385]|uniref:hypothetical protein n=1 Tax=Streptomyces sp. NPDC005385 TaxID=3157039 RepID=UPI0033B853D0
MTRITMPSGAWIELRDPNTLLRGDKKRLLEAMPDTENNIRIGFSIIDGLLQALVTAWSYALPIPSENPESLELLPIGDDEELAEAVEPGRLLLFPEPVKETPEQLENPTSPTAPSAV